MASILIVDDDWPTRVLIQSLFKGSRHQVLEARTLQEARSLLHAIRFSLILLDRRLPDGDGLQFVEELKENPDAAGAQLIMLSAYDPPGTPSPSLYLQKPFRAEEFKRLVDDLLKTAR